MEILKQTTRLPFWLMSPSGFRTYPQALFIFILVALGCERIPEWDKQSSSLEESVQSDRLQHLSRWIWTCRGKVKNFRSEQTQSLLGLQVESFLDVFKEGGVGVIDEVSDRTFMGTAVLWTANGHLLTLYPWTEAVSQIECRNANSPWLAASRVGQDSSLQLSLLKVDLSQSGQIFTKESHWVNRGLENLTMSEPLYVVGRGAPGIFDRLQISLQGTRPNLNTGMDDDLVLFLPRPDQVLSGGLVVDQESRVIAYLFLFQKAPWGVALSSERVETLVQRLITDGKVQRPFLGFRARFVKGRGFVVHQVDVGSPAHQSGLRVEDVLIEWEGRLLTKSADWEDVGFEDIGKTISLIYRREDRQTETQLTVSSSE